MCNPTIINRGRGPELEGTRITVYDVLYYDREGYSKAGIAAVLGLDSRSIQVALDYIKDHEAEVNSEYQKILDRIQAGNSPEIEARQRASHAKLQALMEERKKGAS